MIAILLLFIAGADAWACDVTDSCFTATADSGDGCDQPSGDNCLCCCHHIVPAAVFTLEPCDNVVATPPQEPVRSLLSASRPIDHPPQL